MHFGLNKLTTTRLFFGFVLRARSLLPFHGLLILNKPHDTAEEVFLKLLAPILFGPFIYLCVNKGGGEKNLFRIFTAGQK